MTNNPEYISTTEALEILKKSWLNDQYSINIMTLIRWVEKYKLGFKFAGRWQIDKEKFINFINRENDETPKKTKS